MNSIFLGDWYKNLEGGRTMDNTKRLNELTRSATVADVQSEFWQRWLEETTIPGEDLVPRVTISEEPLGRRRDSDDQPPSDVGMPGRVWRSNSLTPPTSMASNMVSLIVPGQEYGDNSRVTRSNSLTPPGQNGCSVLSPDPRRFSFTSDGSAMSSSSSLSELWPNDLDRLDRFDRRLSSQDFGEFSGHSRRWSGTSSSGVSSDAERRRSSASTSSGEGTAQYRISPVEGGPVNWRIPMGEGGQHRLSVDSGLYSGRPSIDCGSSGRPSLDFSSGRTDMGNGKSVMWNDGIHQQPGIRIEGPPQGHSEMRKEVPHPAQGIRKEAPNTQTNMRKEAPKSPMWGEGPYPQIGLKVEGTHLHPGIRDVPGIRGDPAHQQTGMRGEGPQAKPGMRSVPEWLKSLRLHKYTPMLLSLSYEEMVRLTETRLEQMGVTKGARRKIVASIQKLQERQCQLKAIDEELDRGRYDMRRILADLECMMRSPMKAFQEGPEEKIKSRNSSGSDSGTEVGGSEEEGVGEAVDGNLPGAVTHTLRKVCTNLLLSPNTETHSVSMFVTIVDMCNKSEAFSASQKQLLSSWQHKMRSLWHPLPFRRGSSHFGHAHQDPRRRLSRPVPPIPPHPALARRYSLQTRYNYQSTEGLPLQRQNLPASCRGAPVNSRAPALTVTPSRPFHSGTPLVLPPYLQRRSVPELNSFHNNVFSKNVRDNYMNFPASPTPSSPRPTASARHLDNSVDQQLPGDLHNIDNQLPGDLHNIDNQLHGDLHNIDNRSDGSADSLLDLEINNRLESLCLSVTEHALS